MQRDVKEAIDKGIALRTDVLSSLSRTQRLQLLELLFTDFFVDQHRLLQKWASLTGQTAQIDTGYIAQFVASIITGIPGQGFRGKGDDLVDGSEVKSAANISGVDTPRWNHNMGTAAADLKKARTGEKTNAEKYLDVPYLIYLLADRIAAKDSGAPAETRIRVWCIDVQEDHAWRALVTAYNQNKVGATYNLQLHPPVGYNDNVVTNNTANLDFSDVLVFDFRIALRREGSSTTYWNVEPPETLFPVSGRTRVVPTVDRSQQSRTHTAPEYLVADIAVLPDHFPGILSSRLEDKLDSITEQEAHELSEG